MKKKCLFLLVAFAAASANVRAQKTVTDYDGLKAAVDKVNSIPELQKTVDDKKTAVTAAENAVTAANRTVQEKELAVSEKEAIVKEKEKDVAAAQKVVEAKKADVVPFQKVLDEKTAAVTTAQGVVDEWEKKISDLEYQMENNKYSGYEDLPSPHADLMVNFSQAVQANLFGDPTGFTDEELADMKLYYSAKFASTIGSIYITADDKVVEKMDNDWHEITVPEIDESTPLIELGEKTKKVGIYVVYLDEKAAKGYTQTQVTSFSTTPGEELPFSEIAPDIESCASKLPPIPTPRLNALYPTWEANLAKYKKELGTESGVESGDEVYTDENGVSQKTKYQLWSDAKADEAVAQKAVDAAQKFVDAAQDDVDAAQADVDAAQADVATAEAALREAKGAVITAGAKVETAKGEVTTAEAAVTAANEYKTLTITGDNEFVVTKTLAAEWPADGVIRGNGNKIVNDANTPLFTHNYGSISGLIAPNGRIASYNETGAQVRDCIVKVSSTEYRAYDDNSAVKLYSKLDDAVYSMREYFGYDAKTATATGKVTSDTKLYKAQNKVTSSQPLTASYVNITDAGEVRYASSVSTENTVLYLDDIAVKSDNKNVTAANVAVLQSEVTDVQTGAVTKTYSCKKIELVDGSSRKEFYMPYSVTADELSYSRTTTTNKVPVCMPFDLTNAVKQLIAENVGTNVSNVFFYTLNEVKDGIVWFTPVASIEANKPGLIAFKEDVKLDGTKNIFEGLEQVEVSATPEIADLSAKPLSGGDEAFFGNYKPGQVGSVLLQAHAGAGNVAFCYQGGQLVRMKEADKNGGGTKLNQFRSYVIMKEDVASPNSLPDSFEIGFLDEDGNEVTGIGSVESGKSDNGFKAVGGSGVIAISAEKACDVKVYTAGGSLVKAVRVEAGNTKLPFSAGVYIVNQTKVVVK